MRHRGGGAAKGRSQARASNDGTDSRVVSGLSAAGTGSHHRANRAKGSGRVGRTEAARNLENEPLIAAVRAAVRHKHTRYDEMLAQGIDRMTPRGEVADKIEEILAAWRRSASTA